MNTKIYCGKSSRIPPTYGRRGTPYECMKCGFGSAMMKYKWSQASTDARFPPRPPGQDGCRRSILPEDGDYGATIVRRGSRKLPLWLRNSSGKLSQNNKETILERVFNKKYKNQFISGGVVGFIIFVILKLYVKLNTTQSILYGLLSFVVFLFIINVVIYFVGDIGEIISQFPVEYI